MSRAECRYEADILDAVASGRWPDRADAALREHASTCVICTDVAMIAALYRDDASVALDQTRVPSAGFVWWKSELRARREAVRTASRPMTLVQGIAAACAAIVLLSAAWAMAGGMDISWLSRYVSGFLMAQPLVLWLALGAILALTPIALYFVYSGE